MKNKIRRKKKFIRKNRDLELIFKNLLIIILVVLAGALGVLLFEYSAKGNNIKDFFDAIWWSLVTITTVGYGDLYPVTFWGRIIGIVFILLGFIVFSTFTAFVASNFIDRKIKERKGLSNIKEKNHLLVCGWNNSARSILEYLASANPASVPPIVLINELSEDYFNSLQNNFPNLELKIIKGDFTNQEILIKGRVEHAKDIIILFDESLSEGTPSDERTIIAAHNIIYMNPKGSINLQLKEKKYLPNIRREKIRNVIIYDEVGGNMLGNSTLNPSVPDFIQELLKYNDNKGFIERNISNDFIGKTFEELSLNLKEKEELLALGIVSVQPEFSIDRIISNDTTGIDQFIKKQFELSGKKLKLESNRNHIKIKPAKDYIIQEFDKVIVI